MPFEIVQNDIVNMKVDAVVTRARVFLCSAKNPLLQMIQ